MGRHAIGQPHDQYLIDLDCKVPFSPNTSVDVSLLHYSSAPENVMNRVYANPFNVVDLGGRYQFALKKLPATLRLQAMNITNVHVWNILSSPGFFQFPSRTALAYLTIDI